MSNSIKIDPLGFREYDARWLYPKNINDEGINIVGKGFGSQVLKKIIRNLFRSFSRKSQTTFFLK